MDCAAYPLAQSRVVAIATDRYLTPTFTFQDTTHLPGNEVAPRYGQDYTSGRGRRAPQGQSVGSTVAELRPRMLQLLREFASNDTSGMAARLFASFLAQKSSPEFWDDASLNAAAARHENIRHFCSVALSAPGTRPSAPAGVVRIHQALRQANWDINRLVAPSDLGVPAFNLGSKTFGTDDFGNGLGVMINGIQHAYVVATHYHHDPALGRYCIGLKFLFYDVFGLDDDDLEEFGASSTSLSSSAAQGITAWWQLQHQFGYAPLITRIMIHRAFEAPAT